jgi:hypothetical protein
MRARGPVTIAIAAGALALNAAAASAAPANDDFADARPIQVGQTVRGTTAGATGERGEPSHGPGTRQSVWYRLRSLRRVSVLLSTCRAQGDTVIAIYAGRRVRALTVIDFNDDGCRDLGSRVSFTARPGRTYHIAIVPYSPGDEGSFRLRAEAIDTPPNDDFVDARTLPLGSPVTGTTRNATLELGEPTFYAHSVWFKLRVPSATRMALRSCGRTGPWISVFVGRRVNRLREVDSGFCSVVFQARPGVAYRIQVSHRGTGRRFTLAARPRT